MKIRSSKKLIKDIYSALLNDIYQNWLCYPVTDLSIKVTEPGYKIRKIKSP